MLIFNPSVIDAYLQITFDKYLCLRPETYIKQFLIFDRPADIVSYRSYFPSLKKKTKKLMIFPFLILLLNFEKNFHFAVDLVTNYGVT